MNMHSRETRERAFAMYCADIAPNKISTIMGLKDSTIIYIWRDKFNWDERKKDILRFKEEYSNNSENEQNKKIIESVLATYIKKQTEMGNKLKYSDVFEAIKMRRLLKGESTENINVNNEVMSVKEELERILKEKGENE